MHTVAEFLWNVAFFFFSYTQCEETALGFLRDILQQWTLLTWFSVTIIHKLNKLVIELKMNLHIHVFFSLMGWDWVHLVLRPLFGLLYQPRMIDVDCGATGGMRVGRGNRSTRRKPTPVPLSPPQIPHDLTRARTRADAVGSRRLTAWAMARSTWG
jgi:hypothetical protein